MKQTLGQAQRTGARVMHRGLNGAHSGPSGNRSGHGKPLTVCVPFHAGQCMA